MPFTVSHNVATPGQVREVLEQARAAGAPVWGPVERGWGGFTGYFADPDGFRWEVAWYPGPIGLRAVPPPMSTLVPDVGQAGRPAVPVRR